jgi:uncharacterized protein YciI
LLKGWSKAAMEFFFYCRDRAGAGETRRGLLKEHWAFMRRYADAMIARGPTISADGKAVTGSMHMVDLPSADAARVFAHDDPLARGGVFEDIMVRRFHNVLGRTMWQFGGDPKNPRFLFIGEARPGASAQGRDSLGAQRAYLGHADRAGRIILFGPLLGTDGETWEGTAMLLETPDTAAAEALVLGDPAAASNQYARAVLHGWRFGGEENLQDLVARR